MADGHPLKHYLDSTVSILTNDGRQLIGILRGFDQAVNLIVHDCLERNYTDDGIEDIPVGLQILRGDNVALIGEVDEELEAQIDRTKVKAAYLRPITH